jgi:hypothetical protein
MPTATSVSWHLSWPKPPIWVQRISSGRADLQVSPVLQQPGRKEGGHVEELYGQFTSKSNY